MLFKQKASYLLLRGPRQAEVPKKGLACAHRRNKDQTNRDGARVREGNGAEHGEGTENAHGCRGDAGWSLHMDSSFSSFFIDPVSAVFRSLGRTT